METKIISVNIANVITIFIIALGAFALSNVVQEKTGKRIPYLS